MNNFNAMSDLVADAEELLSKLGRSASPEIRELSSRVESSIGEMQGAFRDRLKAGEDTLRGMTRTAVGFAKQNPSMSIALALAVAVTAIYLMRPAGDD
ncbi:MAG: hypothetical protein ABJD53_13850 [Gammaproteobacteria bacterium]